MTNFLLFPVLLCVNAAMSMDSGIVIYGPTITQPLFDSLNTAFSLSHKGTAVFSLVNQTSDYGRLLEEGKAVILATTLNTLSLPNTSLTFPLFGYPLVIVYNLNATTLYLSQEALVDIFLGRIKNWNDPNLIALNPKAYLPDCAITLVTGSLLSQFTQGLSVLAGEPLDTSFINSNATVKVATDVASKVKVTSYSLGFSWMADAVTTGVKVATLENKDGFYVAPSTGVPGALSEFSAAQQVADTNATVLPHNMPGRLSWPLIGLVYLVLPDHVESCDELDAYQDWVSLVMFETTTDRLAQVFGWEPARALTLAENALGSLSYTFDYRDQLNSITCGSGASTSLSQLYHTIATTSVGQLWSFSLKLLVAYSSINPFLVLTPSATSIMDLLNIMVEGESKSGLDYDVALTFAPVLTRVPTLLSVPLFMASIAPVVNLGFDTQLTLTVPILARIFGRNITHWDHADIKALNPNVDLPAQNIIIFAGPVTSKPDGASNLFDTLLRNTTAYSHVTPTTNSSLDLARSVQFTNFSIGYGFGHSLGDAFNLVPNLLGSTNKTISLSSQSLEACWNSFSDPDCWPLAVPLAMALRRPVGELTCQHQKLAVDFVYWIMQQNVALDQFIVPNTRADETMGEAEYCRGRSLLFTHSELQQFPVGALALVYPMCAIGMVWAVGQAVALAVARNNSDLKSASVLFSLLAVVGVFLMLITPLLITKSELTRTDCGAAIWLVCFGFTLTYGSIFAKVFRLYKIFTSRSLVVPRLSNIKLFYIVMVFLSIDFVLLLIYNILTPPEPMDSSSMVLSDIDLATGYRKLTWNMCSFHQSPVLFLLLTLKTVVALAGAAMAFFIRQVDRRFSATSALGGSFYNMFLTEIIAAILLVLFQDDSDLATKLFIPVLAGLWIVFVTLLALTLDSNVLLACKDLSRPVRRFLNPSKESKNSKGNSKGSKNSKDSGENDSGHKKSHSSTFVVNRDMFPSKYDPFEGALLEKILEELNFQRTAVRRALAATSTGVTATIELPDRHRLSTHADVPAKFNSKSKSIICIPSEDGSSRRPMIDVPHDSDAHLRHSATTIGLAEDSHFPSQLQSEDGSSMPSEDGSFPPSRGSVHQIPADEDSPPALPGIVNVPFDDGSSPLYRVTVEAPTPKHFRPTD